MNMTVSGVKELVEIKDTQTNPPSTLTAAGKEAAIPQGGVETNPTGAQSLSEPAQGQEKGAVKNFKPVDIIESKFYKNIPNDAPENITNAIPGAAKSYNKDANEIPTADTDKLGKIIEQLKANTAKNPGKIGQFDAWVKDDKIYLNANKDANTDIKIYIDKTGIHCSETLTQDSINRLTELQTSLRDAFKDSQSQADIDKVLDFNIDGLQAIYNAYMDGSFSANQIELFKTDSEPKYLVMSFDDKELELKTISIDKDKQGSCKIDDKSSKINLVDIFKDSGIKDYDKLVNSAINAQIEKSKNIPFVRSHITQDTRETASENANTLWQRINEYIFERSETGFPRVTHGTTTDEAKSVPVVIQGEESVKNTQQKEIVSIPSTHRLTETKKESVAPHQEQKTLKNSYSMWEDEHLNTDIQNLFQEQQVNTEKQNQVAQGNRPQQPLTAQETQQTNQVQNEIQTQTKPKGELDEVLKAFNELKLDNEQKDFLKKMISRHLKTGNDYNTAFSDHGNSFSLKQTFESNIKKKINTIILELRSTSIFEETELNNARSFLEQHLNLEKLAIVESDSVQTKNNYTALINGFRKTINPSSE